MKKISKSRASIYNMASMMTYQIITAIFGFVLPGIILNKYGPQLHGYTSTVNNIMSYIALVNAGLAPAAIQALYKPLADENNYRTNQILNAINRFYFRSGFMYIIAIIFCACILPFILNNQISNFNIITIVLAIGASSTLECFIFSKYRVLLQASQHLYIVTIVNIVSYIIRVVTQIILIYMDFSLAIIFIIPAFLTLFRMLALHIYCKRIFSYLDKNVNADMTSLSNRKSAMLHQLAGLVVFNTDITILTLLGNLTQVSIYSVYNLVFNHLYTLMTSVFSHGTVASFGQLISENRSKVLKESFERYEYGYYLVVSFLYSVTGSMILPFISIYTKEESSIPYVDAKLATLFVIVGLANNIRVPSNTLINAAGKFKETQGRAIMEATINIIVSLSLVNKMGMYGLLIGTICSFAYRTTDIVCYNYKHIVKIPVKTAFLNILRVIVIVCINFKLYEIFIGIYSVDSWAQWIFIAFINSCFVIIIVVLVHWISGPKKFIKFIKSLKIK